jgi:hypothetical protein
LKPARQGYADIQFHGWGIQFLEGKGAFSIGPGLHFIASMGKGQGDNAPKRPRSAAILFMIDKRDLVKAANPGITIREILKTLVEQWKVLSDKNRQVYNDRAAKEKEAYDAQKPAKKVVDSSDESEDES